MAAIVEGFVVVNGDTASASYLNSWLNNAGVAVAGAAKLIGNPTATTGTAGTSNWDYLQSSVYGVWFSGHQFVHHRYRLPECRHGFRDYFYRR